MRWICPNCEEINIETKYCVICDFKKPLLPAYDKDYFMIKKIVYFVTLTDPKEIETFGQYESFLMHASFCRQIISTIFSYCVLLYSLSMIISSYYAAFIALLIVLILFFIDQAVIGSEWSLYREYFSYKVINKIANLFIIPLRIIPRILFAITIAYVIAEMAEIGLQHRAIDKVLDKEIKSYNSQYFSKISEKEQDMSKKEDKLKKEISSLEKIKLKKEKELNSTRGKETLLKEKNDLEEKISRHKRTENKIENNIIKNNEILLELEEVVTRNERAIEYNKEERYKEEFDKERGASRGPRWRKFNREVIRLEAENAQYKPKLEASSQKSKTLNSQKKEIESSIFQAKQEIADLETTINSKFTDSRTIEEINNELMKKRTHLKQAINSTKEEINLYKEKLENGGFFQNRIYGLMDRSIALKKLHNDPEYGEEAKNLSLKLKLFIILIELSPVIVMVFFSPYSFYSKRMNEKMEINQRKLEVRKDELSLEEQIHKAEYKNSFLKKIQKIEDENDIIEMDILTKREVTKLNKTIFKDLDSEKEYS